MTTSGMCQCRLASALSWCRCFHSHGCMWPLLEGTQAPQPHSALTLPGVPWNCSILACFGCGPKQGNTEHRFDNITSLLAGIFSMCVPTYHHVKKPCRPAPLTAHLECRSCWRTCVHWCPVSWRPLGCEGCPKLLMLPQLLPCVGSGPSTCMSGRLA